MTNFGYSPLICPHDFSMAMERHWVETLGNASSRPLREVWHQIGTAFGRAILNFDKGQWQVLQPPTGSGKTQGTTIYCAMLAKENLTAQHPAGVLIVSRLKAQCDEMAKAINDHTGQTVAHVHHSDSRLTNDQLDKAMILVITHAALVKAYEGLTKDTQTRWHDFAHWSHGERKLVIVDEALNGIVEQSCLTLDRLGITLGVAKPFKAQHGAELQALEALYRALEERAGDKTQGSFLWTEAPGELLGLPDRFDLYSLRKSIERVQFDHLFMGTESSVDRRRGASLVVDTLRHAEAVLGRWAFYQKKGKRHTLNSALLLIPDDAPSAVVLDATASQSELWKLLGDRVSIIPVPDGARSYANVSLHLCRAKGMGKDRMEQHAEARFNRLSADLQGHLGKDRKVFLCTHKKVTPIAWKHAFAAKTFDVGHWGAIDGRNDWQSCDTVVLFGLPYRDTAWAKGMLTATQGVPSGSTNGDEQADLRRNLQQRQMAVSVIQAINRARCRKAIDSEGNCAPTDVYLVLPPDRDGDAVLAAIRKEMPGIQEKAWDFKPDGAAVAVRRGSWHEAILAFMEAQPAGETFLTTIKERLGIGDMKPIRTALNDASHVLTVALTAMGVTYVRLGSGRATKTLLRKAA